MTFTRASRSIKLAAFALPLALVAACSGGSSSADEVPTIRFGYIADFNGAYQLALAEELGLWDKHSVQVEPVVFTNGPLQVQAMQTDDLDLGSIGPGALWMASTGQAKVVAINGLGVNDRVVALADSGIDEIQDLKGREIAVPEGTSGDMILRVALAEAGMSRDDVEIVSMDPSTVVSSMTSGQIDAAAIWYPLLDTIEEAQPDLVEVASSVDFYPEYTFPGTIVARNDFADEETEAISRFIRVLQDANDYREENFEETITLTAEFLDVTEDNVRSNAENIKYPTTQELVEQSGDDTAANWLASLADLFKGMGQIDDALPVEDYYLPELWIEADEQR
ncbi:aliphatic sulfonate ABC transporter substrate-binding protein [Georgenia subflava]|uniref:Aliphatic sulfonate ABC transporter substrate-binding protein n=1 Tax=Georgenia subflava TaxID=1622177 RepID=A0A6N7EE49_9MICO|nr:aliphatic sulfonate ABC transporter substrate-binding protein [Georgenia subflava]MPV36692.1 aliphatic sulfonate ABC transporter substrate-binding protein [Georgenia subflava]